MEVWQLAEIVELMWKARLWSPSFRGNSTSLD